jgi:hypothetical protein
MCSAAPAFCPNSVVLPLPLADTRAGGEKLEYDYYDFGSKGPTDAAVANEVVTVHSFKDTIHAVTVGLNYHF